MKKFRFAHSTLLRYRKMQEDLARRDLWDAQRKVTNEEQVLRRMYELQDQSRENALTLQKNGGNIIPQLQLIEEYNLAEKKRIEEQRDIIRGLKQIAEEKQERLVEHARETKIVEKLKERAKQEFETAVDKKEVKTADDMTTMRFNRRS